MEHIEELAREMDSNAVEAHLRNALDAERLALGAMISDPDLVVDAYNKHQIKASDFLDSGHAKLYEALVGLVIEQGSGVDVALIIDELIERYGMPYEEASNLALLWTSPDLVHGPLVFEKHIEQLKKASRLRRLHASVQEILQRVYQGIDDPSALKSIAIETLEQYLSEEPQVEDDEKQLFDAPDAEPTAALGWVAQYADTIGAMTSSPRSFNLLNAMVLGATAIAGKAKLNMPFGTVRPNLYGALIGPSSVYHKTTSLQRAKDVLRRAGLERLLLPEAGSSEGLFVALSEQPAGLIVRDEIARLFGADRVRHLAMYKADLTDLYAGETVRKRLSNAEIQVERPYLCILGATTPTRFFDAIGANDWDDGFLVRWLFALPDCEPKFETLCFYESEAEIDRKLNELAAPLRQIAQQPETSFRFDQNSFSRWDAWQREKLEKAYYFGDETALAVSSRTSTSALKLAMILAAVNGEWGRISATAMEGAIWLADTFAANFWKLINDQKEHSVSGHKLAKVHQVIKRAGAAGCSKKQIMQYAHIKAHQLRPVLEKLLALGAVIVSNDGKRYISLHDKLPVKNYS